MARSDADRCRELKALLSLHASADLEAEEARRIDAHLARCAACRRELEVWRGQVERLREVRREGVEAPLSRLFWKAIRLRISREPIPIERLRRRRLTQAWVGAAAALLLGAGISLVAFSVLRGGAPPAAPAPTALRAPAAVEDVRGDVPVFPAIEDRDLPRDWMGAIPQEIPL